MKNSILFLTIALFIKINDCQSQNTKYEIGIGSSYLQTKLNEIITSNLEFAIVKPKYTCSLSAHIPLYNYLDYSYTKFGIGLNCGYAIRKSKYFLLYYNINLLYFNGLFSSLEQPILIYSFDIPQNRSNLSVINNLTFKLLVLKGWGISIAPGFGETVLFDNVPVNPITPNKIHQKKITGICVFQ